MLPTLRPHQQLNFRWIPKGLPVLEKIELLIERITETGCWIWMGALSPKGYAKINGKIAHRSSYEAYIGPIPDGLQLDHVCRVRCCVNPHHLEPVTLQVNVARGEVGQYNARKTHCANSHEFTPENTGRTNGERYCRTCRNLARKDKRKAEGKLSRGTLIEHNGVSLSLKNWSRKAGLNHSTISKRLARGLSFAEAIRRDQ